jgi:hypothetical protein
MAKHLMFLTILAAGSSSLTPTEVQPGLAHFRIVWERSDSGFRAECAAGCLWKKLTFKCASGCRALIDANGLNPDSLATIQPSPFAFRMEPTLDGWHAESLRGTAWRALSYGCRSFSCRALMDEHGVSGLPF